MWRITDTERDAIRDATTAYFKLNPNAVFHFGHDYALGDTDPECDDCRIIANTGADILVYPDTDRIGRLHEQPRLRRAAELL